MCVTPSCTYRHQVQTWAAEAQKKKVGQFHRGLGVLPHTSFNREDVILCILMHFYMWLILSVDQSGFYLLKRGTPVTRDSGDSWLKFTY